VQLFALDPSMNPMTPEATISPAPSTEEGDSRIAEAPHPPDQPVTGEPAVAAASSLRARVVNLLRRLTGREAQVQAPVDPAQSSEEERASSRMWTFLGFSTTWAVSPGRLWGSDSESGPCRVIFAASIIDHLGDRSKPVLRLILGRLAIWVTRV